jgi:hypothetical protein
LMDIVIIDPTCLDMVQQALTTRHMQWRWLFKNRHDLGHQMNTRQWLHSPYYWNIWVFSFSFWFIFYRLCENHYRASSTIFFSPLNVYFSLLTMCVHSLVMCANHNNSSVGCYTWLGSSSLPHIIISGPMSLANLWQMTTFLS